MRDIHRRLAERGLALPVYSSNLGGTYAGWFVTGGVGLNAFGGRRAADIVRAADVVLPVRRARALPRRRAPRRARPRCARRAPRGPGRRGRGVVPRPRPASPSASPISPAARASSASSCSSCSTSAGAPTSAPSCSSSGTRRTPSRPPSGSPPRPAATLPRPANLRLVLGSHLRHLRAIWAEEDARAWRRRPSSLSRGDGMPWARLDGPEELRTPPESLAAPGGAAVRRPRRRRLPLRRLPRRARRRAPSRPPSPSCRARPRALGDESVRIAAERFRPQQNKRFGPGLLAAEVVLPAARRLAVPARRLPPGPPRRRRARPGGLLPRGRTGGGRRTSAGAATPSSSPATSPITARPRSTSTSCWRRRCSTWPCGASPAGPTCSGAGRRRSPPTASGRRARSGSPRSNAASTRRTCSTAASCSAWACAGRSAASWSASTGRA